MHDLSKIDPTVATLIEAEETRIEETLNMIAAENHAPRSIMQTLGSIFNTKTIEGYPGNRFHAGCVNADKMENLAIKRGQRLFGAEYVNVQPHSGTSANLAVYFAVLNPGDRILSMSLPHGGHLSHGHPASISAKCFEFSHYGVDQTTERIDYDQIRKLAHQFQPRLIIAGASSYPRIIDYEKMAIIAEEISAFLMADMAHLAGLVAAKVIPSPVPACDFTTFTCYKTLMGGRGGVILAKQKYGTKIDRAIFPGSQGTSAVNLIAAKAHIFKLATQPKYTQIQQNTLENAVCLASALQNRGYRIVTGGTETHQILIDVTSKGQDGNTAEKALESLGIIVNRNVIPQDAARPGAVSGVRLGTAALSTRGMGKPQMIQIAGLIDAGLKDPDNSETKSQISLKVSQLCKAFPVYRQTSNS